ncbi:unnamed protein product [Caretta caretta]
MTPPSCYRRSRSGEPRRVPATDRPGSGNGGGTGTGTGTGTLGSAAVSSAGHRPGGSRGCSSPRPAHQERISLMKFDFKKCPGRAQTMECCRSMRRARSKGLWSWEQL